MDYLTSNNLYSGKLLVILYHFITFVYSWTTEIKPVFNMLKVFFVFCDLLILVYVDIQGPLWIIIKLNSLSFGDEGNDSLYHRLPMYFL